MDLFSATLDDFESLSDDIVAAPGVYACLDAEGVPLYIGQSGDVVARQRQHAADKRKKWYGRVAEVRFRRVADVQNRLVLETGLVLRYRPRHNRAIKIGIRSDGTIYEIQFIRGRRG